MFFLKWFDYTVKMTSPSLYNTVDVSIDGYVAYGVVGHYFSEGTNYFFPSLYVTSNTVYYTVREMNGNTPTSSIGLHFIVLYIKIV